MAAGHWNCCVSTSESLDCQNPSNFTVDAPAPESLSTIKQINTPVPSPAELTPIGSITSVSTTPSGSVGGNGTMSASGSAMSANMTLTFSGAPMHNTSSASSTTSRHRTGQRSTITSTAVTQQTQQVCEYTISSAMNPETNIPPRHLAHLKLLPPHHPATRLLSNPRALRSLGFLECWLDCRFSHSSEAKLHSHDPIKILIYQSEMRQHFPFSLPLV